MPGHRASRLRVVTFWLTVLTVLGFILPSVLYVLFSEIMAFDRGDTCEVDTEFVCFLIAKCCSNSTSLSSKWFCPRFVLFAGCLPRVPPETSPSLPCCGHRAAVPGGLDHWLPCLLFSGFSP